MLLTDEATFKYGESVEYGCKEGFHFDDWSETASATCSLTGDWSGLKNCTGLYHAKTILL